MLLIGYGMVLYVVVVYGWFSVVALLLFVCICVVQWESTNRRT